MSVLIEIADAVTAALNAASLGQSFTAQRLYVPVRELEDFNATTLEVSVVPRQLTMAMLSRRDDDFDYVIDVGIQRGIGRGAMTAAQIAAACDPLMTFAESVLDLFRGVRLAGYEDALCVAGENLPVYQPQHLDEFRVFTSVVSLTFRKARARA